MPANLWPEREGGPDFREPFRQVGSRKLHPVIQVAGIEELRKHVITDRAGRWTGFKDTLDLSEVYEAYGREIWEQTPVVICPAPEGHEQDREVFRMEGDSLLPPRGR